jgi:hypothetical protein
MFADGLNLSTSDQNHLIRKHSARVHVHELSSANYGDLGRRWRLLCWGNRCENNQEEKN